MRTTTLLALAWILALGAGAAPSPPSPLPGEEQLRAVRAAWIAERSGNLDLARLLYAQAGATWPDDPFLLDETLRFLDRTGKDAAIAAGLRARLLAALSDPARPLPVPVVRRQILDKDAARSDLELLRATIAARLVPAPSDPDLLSVLADVQRRLEDAEGLAATLDKLAAARPSHALTWERLLLAMHRGRWPEAKALLDRVEADGDRSPFVHRVRLSVLAHLGSAEAVLQAAGTPEDPAERESLANTLEQIGWELWDAGRDAEAEAVFRRALAIAPQDTSAGQIVGTLFATAEERAARAAATEQSWQRVDDASKLLQEGSSRLVAGDAESAYPLLLRATAALPEEVSAWYNLGLAAKKMERWEEAVRALEHALALRADWAPALRALADAQWRAGTCPAAVSTARRAAEVDPGNADPYVTLFNCLQALGDHQGAAAAKLEYERRRGPTR